VFSRGSNPDSNIPKPPGLGPAPGQGAAPPAPGTGRQSPFGPTSTMGSSVIGTDLTILGEKITIISQNMLQIDGDVRGDVNGKQVIIGEEGSVIGTVSAESIEVRGGIRGAIRANAVILHPTSEVEGDIFHQTLSISEGAQFDGRVRRSKDENELRPNLDVGSFPTPATPTNGSGE
jgi:cytoskeletal protein CcmA (bactofilin family)